MIYLLLNLKIFMDCGLRYKKSVPRPKKSRYAFCQSSEIGQVLLLHFLSGDKREINRCYGICQFFGDPTIAYGKEKKRKKLIKVERTLFLAVIS